MSYCKECGSQLDGGTKFCSKCGYPAPMKEIAFCRKCGHPLAQNVNFCNQCGTSSNPVNDPSAAVNNVLPQQSHESFPLRKVGMFTALGKYADFSGRSTRKEYWLFQLFLFLSYFITFIVVNVFVEGVMRIQHSGEPGVAFVALLSLVFLVPSLAVAVRRLHDTGNSGWLLLVTFVPVIGGVILLCFLLKSSERQDNKYGACPLCN